MHVAACKIMHCMHARAVCDRLAREKVFLRPEEKLKPGSNIGIATGCTGVSGVSDYGDSGCSDLTCVSPGASVSPDVAR